jgi:hypothetical protein
VRTPGAGPGDHADWGVFADRIAEPDISHYTHGCMSLAGFAAGLAAADLPVLPLLPRTKRPRYEGGYKSATCDLDRVADHWRGHSADNIGVRPPLGMIVVDIDPRNGGMKSMQKLIDEHGRLPKTWVAQTGGGGWHYWLVVSEMPVRAHLCDGVDIKHGDSGFVVAPPSTTSFMYRWIKPPLGDVALAPEWLREALQPPVHRPCTEASLASTRTNGLYSLQCLLARIEGAPVGRRHDTALGAFLDAAAQGDLDAFEAPLAAAAIAAEQSPVEVEDLIRYARGGG